MVADITLEEIWKFFQDTGQGFRGTDEKFRETAPKFREMDHSLDDLEAIVARTSRNVDNLIRKWSKFLEGMVVLACKSLFAEHNISVHKISQRVQADYVGRTMETVLTYYHALADGSPVEQRKRLLATPWSDWAELILHDLSRPHPDIRELVSRIDIIRWGHAMVRPHVGFIWSEACRRIIEYNSRIHFAHSDLSGYSIFEEARYRGVLAAERVLDRLGVSFSSSL